MKNAIILFSGGLDSTTCLAIAKSEEFTCTALSFSYGQRHSVELTAAKNIAEHFNVKHIILDLPIWKIGGSALTDNKIDVPEYSGGNDIPITYVPARNTVFLSFALGLAEVSNASHIFIGVSAVDYSGYPDCRPEYIQAFQNLANLATKIGVEENNITINTPLINLSKADTIKLGIKHGVNYGMTISCYQATKEGHACSKCDSCALRRKGFLDAGIEDPTVYSQGVIYEK